MSHLSPPPAELFCMLEPVDVASAGLIQILKSAAAGIVNVLIGDGSCAAGPSRTLRDIHSELLLRSADHGNIPVVYHRDELGGKLSSPGRWYSGLKNVNSLKGDVKDRVNAAVDAGVPPGRATSSVFAFPRFLDVV
jgi:hypothetical protein